MEMMSSSSKQESLPELTSALEKATLMIKHLPSTTNQTQLHQIYTSLHTVHHQLTMFLLSQSTPFPPENSMSSAVDGGGDELMQVADEEETVSLDGVQEKMKDWCFVQNKRPKRLLSPSEGDQLENEAVGSGGAARVDPHEKKLRALDLIYQFHS